MPAKKKGALPKELPFLEHFSLSVIPVKGESYCGYLHRLTVRNQLPSFGCTLELIGTYEGAHRLEPVTLSRLSKASGFAPSVIEKYLGSLPLVGASDAHWGMWSVPTAISRICPQCFEEAPIHRQIWQHRFVNVCPIHECLIVSDCPECGLPLRWRRPRLAECRDRHSLRRLQGAFVSDGLLEATRHFYELIGLPPRWPKPIIHEDVAQLSREDFTIFVRRLGLLVDKLSMLNLATEAGSESRNSERVLHARSDAALTRSMEIIGRWPASFHELLDSFVSPGIPFIQDCKLFAWLRDGYLGDLLREAPAPYRVIKRALLDLAADLGDTVSIRRHEDPDGLASIEEVVRMTGLSRAIVEGAVSACRWKTCIRIVGRRKHVFVKLSDVENWQASPGGDIIAVAQVTELLGIGIRHVMKLAARGLLGNEARTASEERSQLKLKRSDVNDLLQRLLKQRMGKARKTLYPAMTCPAIPREHGKVGKRSLTFMIETVAAGKLRYWGEPNLPQEWHFYERDFEGLFRRRKLAHS